MGPLSLPHLVPASGGRKAGDVHQEAEYAHWIPWLEMDTGELLAHGRVETIQVKELTAGQCRAGRGRNEFKGWRRNTESHREGKRVN